MTVYRTEA